MITEETKLTKRYDLQNNYRQCTIDSQGSGLLAGGYHFTQIMKVTPMESEPLGKAEHGQGKCNLYSPPPIQNLHHTEDFCYL